MDVLLLNTYDWGGAATASKRIHRGLRRIGINSRMLVQHEREDEPGVIGPNSRLREAFSLARIVSDSWPLKAFGGSEAGFSVNWLPDDVPRQVDRLNPDLVHLNWVGEGFLTPSSVAAFDVPVVWRFPDMWPMTGGCHYAEGCEGFKADCGNCPQLSRSFSHDVTWWTLRRKRRAWKNANITVVAPSTWLAEQAQHSAVFENKRIEVIPNALDTDVFAPYDQDFARRVFDLPSDERVILFGAVGPTSDPRKGFEYLHEAVKSMAEDWTGDDVRVVVFGANKPDDPPDFGFETRYTGYLHDEVSLALLYAAADVMVVPSKYEGFGQTVIESMACGTPVVAFDATGPRDTVDHRETGYLAEPYESADLRAGIEWVMTDDRPSELGDRARERAVDRYSLETVANQYRDLYDSLLA